MPAPSTGDEDGHPSFRPQPPPRLLRPSEKNEAAWTLYENLRNLNGRHKGGTSTTTTETEATGAIAEQQANDEDPNDNRMSGSNQYSTRGAGGLCPARRSTTLPATHGTSIPSLVRRHANTLGGRPIVTAAKPSYVGPNTQPGTGQQRKCVASSNCGRSVSPRMASNGESATSETTIKCMPYNSPGLARRQTNSSGVYSSDALIGCGRLQSKAEAGKDSSPATRKQLTVTRPSNYRYAPKSMAGAGTGGLGVTDEARTNAADGQQPVIRGPFLATTNVRRYRQLQLSQLTRRGAAATTLSSSHESVDRLSDSSTSLCSTHSSSTPTDAATTAQRRTEYRKSASIPPQLVANLTSQFNSLIKQNQLLLKPEMSSETGEGPSPLVIKPNSQTTTASTVAPLIWSVPSSSSNVRGGIRPPRASQQHREVDQKEHHNATSLLHSLPATSIPTSLHRRARPKGFALSSNDRGYVSATDGNESSDSDPGSRNSDARNRRLASSSDCLSSEADGSPEPKFNAKLGPVRKAIHSYEVALMKATSSPEFPRKCRSGDPVVSAVDRQVQTLPATTQAPSRLMSGYHSATTAVVHTLPHVSWAAAREASSFNPHSTDVDHFDKRLPATMLTKPSDANNDCREKKIGYTGFHFKSSCSSKTSSAHLLTSDIVALQTGTTKSPIVSNSSTTVNGPLLPKPRESQGSNNSFPGLTRYNVNRPLPLISGQDSVFHARPALVVNHLGTTNNSLSASSRPDSPLCNTGDDSEKPAQKVNSAHDDDNQISACYDRLVQPQRSAFLSTSSLANRKSMDLLAEIDNHPSMKGSFLGTGDGRINSWRLRTFGGSEGEIPTAEKTQGAPNTSFLWRDSTQTQVHQEKPNPFYSSSFPDGGSTPSSSGGTSSSCGTSSAGEGATNGFVFPPPGVGNGIMAFRPGGDDGEEHLYEELFNCRSRPLPIPGPEPVDLPVPNPPPRADVPMPLPTSDGGGSSDDGSATEVATYALNRDAMCEKIDEPLHEIIPDYNSDESWIDDSDDGNDPSDKNSRNAAGQNGRTKIRGKKPSNRKMLMRRSWSRSLRDLVISHDHNLESDGCGCAASGDGPWEDGIESDESPSHVYNKLDVKLAKENCKYSDEAEEATDSITPDTDSDKSPMSAAADDECGIMGSAGDYKDLKGAAVKTKKVKRNWSWTKTDFRLDFTSKMRLNRKPSLSSATENGGPHCITDLSPTKRRQWLFKSKSITTPKKTVVAATSKVVSPKRTPSPKKESAQFYIPTRNSDGTLASPPGCMANFDFQGSLAATTQSTKVELESNPSKSKENCPIPSSNYVDSHGASTTKPLVAMTAANAPHNSHSGSASNLSTCSASTVTSRKARRVSNPGIITRPTTAPPAPPVNASGALRGTSSTISLGHPLPVVDQNSSSACNLPDSCESGSHGSPLLAGLRRMNSSSSDASSSKRSLNGTARVGGSSNANHCSSSSISSDGETSITLTRRTTARSSVASAHSNSSCESYILPEEAENEADSRISMLARFLQSDPAINEESSADTLTNDAKSSCRNFLDLGNYFYNYEDKNLKLSPFEDEPLYQFYNKAAQERCAHENQMDGSDDDCYESLYQGAPSEASSTLTSTSGSSTGTVPSAMDLVKSTQGGARTLWCEVAEVRGSGILESIDPMRRKLQEAMFEVITSEASYLKSLNILINHFMLCPAFVDDYSIKCVLNRRERHVLFSDVVPVRETSERLLAALEKRWQENIVISDICDILQEHATKYFDVYVKYCSNQIYQDRCLKQLKETNSQFVDILRSLESSSVCQSLSMYSFLMLPMQRITRMPLLVDAIFNRLVHGTKEFETCKQALATINKLVHECNEGALRMERMEEMLLISRQLNFGEFKGVALISASRWLVKKGELNLLTFGEGSKIPFGKRCSKLSVYVFLFTDLLIITTKKKSEDGYNVLDHCPRNMVQVMEIERLDQLPDRPPDGCRNIFQLTMLQNHDNKTMEMYLSCSTESDLTRWMEAVPPKRSDNPDERIYEEWDCPQVQAIHCYVSQQPDELALEESDVVNVFRKMADGWYQGERIRDGVQGWFPSNYTVEIVSSHVRARNLRQRYRLLALSYSYMEEQRKKEGKCK